jgi:hypothetical protein
MHYTLVVPRISAPMTSALLEAVFPAVGTLVAVGAKLADLKVDLSDVAAQDCPPITHYRLVARDRAWLRELRAACGDEVPVGATIAVLTSEPDEPLDSAPARVLRVTVAGILGTPPAWPGGAD